MINLDTYQSNAGEVPIMRKWFVRALVVSLLLHAGLLVFFRSKKLERFTPYTERLVPRAFNLGHAEIDSKLLNDEEEKPVAQKVREPEAKPIQPLPDEKESFEKMLTETRITPSAPDEIKPIVSEKPKVEATSLQAMAKAKDDARQSLENELDAVRDQLIKDKPKVSSQSLLNLSNAAKQNANDGAGGSNAARTFSNLDSLLSGGSLKGPVAPLNLPGGALFGFDKADILPQAEEMLHKLAKLIEKNPRAIFTVEGYADSIGEATPEGHVHNLDLSQRRADAVKEYLIARMHIDPSRIESRGYGSTKFLTPPSGDADREAQNRRVEIVIRTQH